MTNKKYKMMYDYRKRTSGGFFGCYVSFFTTYNRDYDGITFFDWGEIDGFNIRTFFG